MPYKHDYDKILTRLVTMLSRLNDGEALSVKELAEEFNVSERTIQRDFNERLVSFPIYQENKKWKMMDGYKLEKTSSIEDAVVLDIIEKLAEGAGHRFAMKAERLLSKLKNDRFNPFYARLDMEDIGDKLEEVQKLEEAIGKKRLVSCDYDFETFRRRIDLKPLKIVNYQGFWYLVALDARNDVLKKYYLKNLSRIEIGEDTFTTDAKLDTLLENAISIWFDEGVEPYRVVLELSAEVAKYFRRKPLSPMQRIEEVYEDGRMVISVEITDDREIMPLIKQWIPYVTVREPLRIAEKVKHDVKVFFEALS